MVNEPLYIPTPEDLDHQTRKYRRIDRRSGFKQNTNEINVMHGSSYHEPTRKFIDLTIDHQKKDQSTKHDLLLEEVPEFNHADMTNLYDRAFNVYTMPQNDETKNPRSAWFNSKEFDWKNEKRYVLSNEPDIITKESIEETVEKIASLKNALVELKDPQAFNERLEIIGEVFEELNIINNSKTFLTTDEIGYLRDTVKLLEKYYDITNDIKQVNSIDMGITYLIDEIKHKITEILHTVDVEVKAPEKQLPRLNIMESKHITDEFSKVKPGNRNTYLPENHYTFVSKNQKITKF